MALETSYTLTNPFDMHQVFGFICSCNSPLSFPGRRKLNGPDPRKERGRRHMAFIDAIQALKFYYPFPDHYLIMPKDVVFVVKGAIFEIDVNWVSGSLDESGGYVRMFLAVRNHVVLNIDGLRDDSDDVKLNFLPGEKLVMSDNFRVLFNTFFAREPKK